MVTMVTTKVSQSYFRCIKLFIHEILSSFQVYRREYSRLFIADMCICHYWRHTIHCSSVCAKPPKKTFSVFLSFFLVKLSKSRSLKLNISRTAWPILMIMVSFCRILNGLSNEINLFWRCSSPLRDPPSTRIAQLSLYLWTWSTYSDDKENLSTFWFTHQNVYCIHTKTLSSLKSAVDYSWFIGNDTVEDYNLTPLLRLINFWCECGTNLS